MSVSTSDITLSCTDSLNSAIVTYEISADASPDYDDDTINDEYYAALRNVDMTLYGLSQGTGGVECNLKLDMYNPFPSQFCFFISDILRQYPN